MSEPLPSETHPCSACGGDIVVRRTAVVAGAQAMLNYRCEHVGGYRDWRCRSATMSLSLELQQATHAEFMRSHAIEKGP